VNAIMPSRPLNFSLGTESEAAMFADLYKPDVFFSYQSMGMDQLVGAAADIVNVDFPRRRRRSAQHGGQQQAVAKAHSSK